MQNGLRGVSDGTRTRGRRDHNPELYQLSYAHQARAESSVRPGLRCPGSNHRADAKKWAGTWSAATARSRAATWSAGRPSGVAQALAYGQAGGHRLP